VISLITLPVVVNQTVYPTYAQLIVGRISIYPSAPKVGENADISIFIQNVGNTSINLSDFTAELIIDGVNIDK
jgi:archaellum component FlaG (FlaF/FlaG flagellin family)